MGVDSVFWVPPTWPITVPHGGPRELARYVQEGLPEVRDIVHRAQGALQRSTGDPALFAYASGDPAARAFAEIRAIFEQLQSMKPIVGGQFAYVLEPSESAPGRGQRIRLAREVLHWGQGTCIDWVLLFAACLLQAHVNPVVVLTMTHAVAGYWTNEPRNDRRSTILTHSVTISRGRVSARFSGR